MGSVTSLAVQRKKHDDGRCHEPGCDGVYRVMCPYRGEHPHPCPHTKTRVRKFLLHGFLPSEVTECVACGNAVYSTSVVDDDLSFW